MKERPHAALIIEWAKGAEIQYRKPETGVWEDCPFPAWMIDYEYRVKPSEPEREYPQTAMTNEEISVAAHDAVIAASPFSDYQPILRRGIANAALRHALDNGQVVTSSEFDRAIGNRAARDLAVVGAVIEHFRPTLEMFNLQVPQAWQLQAVLREWIK
jgi:hypothetical protein